MESGLVTQLFRRVRQKKDKFEVCLLLQNFFKAILGNLVRLCLRIKKTKEKDGDIAQWWVICQACTRAHAQPTALPLPTIKTYGTHGNEVEAPDPVSWGLNSRPRA